MAIRDNVDRVKDAADSMRHRVEDLGENAAHRAGEAVEAGKRGLAGGIDRVSDDLDARARAMDEGGVLPRQVGKAMHRASDALEGSASYLRTHNIAAMRDDLLDRIREHPFLSVFAALGAGFLLGRLVGGRGEEEEGAFEAREVREARRPGAMQGMGGQLGRALLGGVSAMAARRLRSRIAGR